MAAGGELGRLLRRSLCGSWKWVALAVMSGCGHVLPIAATFRGDASANVTADATVRGAFEVKMPSAVDPGDMTATVVRPGHAAAP